MMSNHEAPALADLSLCNTIQDIESLVLDYYPYVRRLAFSILDDFHEADDAAQETFLVVCRLGDSFRGQAQPKTWLTTIAVNVCRGRLRKRKLRQKLQSVLEGLHLVGVHAATPEKAILQNEANRRIWQAVETLEDNHRLTVILHYVHELKAPEIAAVMGTSEGTVYSRLHYARQRLKLLLDSPTSRAEVTDGTL
jgi:RNA polymerase sigma-70 factor (ECF subfamily)